MVVMIIYDMNVGYIGFKNVCLVVGVCNVFDKNLLGVYVLVSN